MKVKSIKYILGTVLCTVFLWMLSSCESDSVGETPDVPVAEQPVHELQVTLGSQQFSSDDSAVRSRAAGDMPTGFSATTSYFDQIQTYMTYQENGVWKYTSAIFNYSENNKNWTSRVPLKDCQHYVYGYMPKSDVQGSVTIEPLPWGTSGTTFSNGAILTLRDVNVVTPNDICVIVGAAGYSTTKPDMSTRLGSFRFSTETASPDGDNIFLLIDHLYAGLKFKMKLSPNYALLRSIKVKNIKLIPDNGGENVVEAVTAVIKVVANNTGINPIIRHNDATGSNISGEVTFPTEGFRIGKNPRPAVLYDGAGKDLTTTAQEFLACFCASTNNKFTLETTYDVYDRKGNLIRENETARNTISLLRTLTPGQIHTVNITVDPTYLYMLSEPDLDNPSFNMN